MPPNTTWSDLSKFHTKSACGWKELMSECLMKTEISPDFEKSEKYTRIDPNALMNVRHEMVKSHFCKFFPIPKEQIKTEAVRLLREENHKKLLKQKEEKLVKREIDKLQQILDDYRLISKTVTENKIKPKSAPKFEKRKTKFWKRLESFEGICEVDTWYTDSLQMTMETKMNEKRVPFDVKVHLKRRKENEENSSDKISCRKGSIIEESLLQDKLLSWDREIEDGKKEIMDRFFKSEDLIKPEMDLNNQKHIFLKDKKTEKLSTSNFEIEKDAETKEKLMRIRMEKADKHRLSRAWKLWRVYTLACQKRRKERKLYENKIETFLEKLQERRTQDSQQPKKIKKDENITRKPSFKKTEKILPKQDMQQKIKNKEKEEKLLKIAKDIKESQKEAHERLVAIEDKTEKVRILKTFTNIFETVTEKGKAFSNPKFLQRMEKRREERTARRREIEERKKQREEEKEKARREKEEGERKLKEQEKRRELEELKEKRRREKQKKEEEKRERERLVVLTKHADDHYKKMLLRSYGLKPWLKLMRVTEEQKETADAFAEKITTKNVFRTWATNVSRKVLQKKQQADNYYEKTLRKNFFYLWWECCRERTRQVQVAVDWRELRLTDWALHMWLDFTQQQQLNTLSKLQIAELYYERRLKQKYLKILENYPELKKLQLARETRRRMLTQKVLEILPDYKPMNVSTDS